MSLTNYAESALLNSLFGKTSSFGALGTAPTLYIGLYTGDPTDAGTQTSEPTIGSGGYARKQTAAADWNASSGGTSVSNANALAFPESTAAWSTGATPVAYFALLDAATAGNMIASGALTTSRTVNAAGVTLSFAASALTATMD